MAKEPTKETSVIQAIAAAMADFKELEKKSFNKFDNYNFTSVDDFLDATRPVLAKHGLIVSMDETACEHLSRNSKPWLQFTFAFQLHCGLDSLGQFTRTVFVPFNGAQATGAAQSYALKQFLRGQFQLSCGDHDDPDHNPADNSPVDIEIITKLEAKTIRDLLTKLDMPEPEWCAMVKIPAIEKLEKSRFVGALQWLQEKRNSQLRGKTS